MATPTGNTQVLGTTVHSDPRSAAKAEIGAQIKEVAAQDRAPGLRHRSAKSKMLDTAQFDRAHPQYHHRYINVKNVERLALRIEDGYVEVPRPAGKEPTADEYGRRLGDDLVLFRQPRANYEARIKDQEELTRARERAHVAEVEQIAALVTQQLRALGHSVDRPMAYNEATQ